MNQIRDEELAVAKLNIPSPAVLADRLGLNLKRLAEIASRAESFYSPFDLESPHVHLKKSLHRKHGTSTARQGISNPMQRTIERALLHPILFPPHIFGAVRSRSIQANASFHLGTRLLIAIDIRGCFPSISNQQVYRTWTSTLGCSASVITQNRP